MEELLRRSEANTDQTRALQPQQATCIGEPLIPAISGTEQATVNPTASDRRRTAGPQPLQQPAGFSQPQQVVAPLLPRLAAGFSQPQQVVAPLLPRLELRHRVIPLNPPVLHASGQQHPLITLPHVQPPPPLTSQPPPIPVVASLAPQQIQSPRPASLLLEIETPTQSFSLPDLTLQNPIKVDQQAPPTNQPQLLKPCSDHVGVTVGYSMIVSKIKEIKIIKILLFILVIRKSWKIKKKTILLIMIYEPRLINEDNNSGRIVFQEGVNDEGDDLRIFVIFNYCVRI